MSSYGNLLTVFGTMMELSSGIAFSKLCPMDISYKTGVAVFIILIGNKIWEQLPQVDPKIEDIEICFFLRGILIMAKHLGVQNWGQKIGWAIVKQKEELTRYVFSKIQFIFVLEKSNCPTFRIHNNLV